MRSIPVALAVSFVLLAACGGSDDDSAPVDEPATDTADATADDDGGDTGDTGDDAPAGDGSTYTGELEDGTNLTVRLDVEPTDPVVAPFVEFRELVGVTDPVVWIVGSVEVPADYDDAMGPPTGRFLTFVPPGGELISDTNPTSSFACSELDTWFGTPTGDDATELTDAYIEFLGSACDGQTLGVIAETGATTDYAMIVDGSDLPEFESLYAGLLTELTPA